MWQTKESQKFADLLGVQVLIMYIRMSGRLHWPISIQNSNYPFSKDVKKIRIIWPSHCHFSLLLICVSCSFVSLFFPSFSILLCYRWSRRSASVTLTYSGLRGRGPLTWIGTSLPSLLGVACWTGSLGDMWGSPPPPPQRNTPENTIVNYRPGQTPHQDTHADTCRAEQQRSG